MDYDDGGCDNANDENVVDDGCGDGGAGDVTVSTYSTLQLPFP
jgi:hypothetical protein